MEKVVFFFLHLATVPCFPLLAILCFPALNMSFMFFALDCSFRFSCAFYQVFPLSIAVASRVGTEFIFSRSSHTFHVSRAWQQLQVFPRVSTSSPTLAAVSCFPALITGFIISAVLTSALVYYAAVICVVTQRCSQKERSIVVTRQVTACKTLKYGA